MNLTLIHLSDLHFHALPRKWRQWRSKRFAGALNLMLRRARQHPLSLAKSLVVKVREMHWDHLVISGDLTQLGLPHEFEVARKVLDPLLTDPERVTIIPGNHDRYVSNLEEKEGFEYFFGEYFGTGIIHHRELKNGWRIIGWDSSHPNPWWSASGTVRRSTLLASEDLIRKDAAKKTILVNHFPLTFPEQWRIDPHHELYNLAPVRDWVMSNGSIRLYLHGHIHQNWLHRNYRENGTPLLCVNSASSTQVPQTETQSAFHRISISDEQIHVEPMRLKWG